MELTSIALKPSTKEKLEALKIHPRQSFDDVVLKLLGGNDENGSKTTKN